MPTQAYRLTKLHNQKSHVIVQQTVCQAWYGRYSRNIKEKLVLDNIIGSCEHCVTNLANKFWQKEESVISPPQKVARGILSIQPSAVVASIILVHAYSSGLQSAVRYIKTWTACMSCTKTAHFSLATIASQIFPITPSRKLQTCLALSSWNRVNRKGPRPSRWPLT